MIIRALREMLLTGEAEREVCAKNDMDGSAIGWKRASGRGTTVSILFSSSLPCDLLLFGVAFA